MPAGPARRRRRALVAATAILVGCGDASPDATSASSEPPQPWEAGEPGWTELPPPPDETDLVVGSGGIAAVARWDDRDGAATGPRLHVLPRGADTWTALDPVPLTGETGDAHARFLPDGRLLVAAAVCRGQVIDSVGTCGGPSGFELATAGPPAWSWSPVSPVATVLDEQAGPQTEPWHVRPAVDDGEHLVVTEQVDGGPDDARHRDLVVDVDTGEVVATGPEIGDARHACPADGGRLDLPGSDDGGPVVDGEVRVTGRFGGGEVGTATVDAGGRGVVHDVVCVPGGIVVTFSDGTAEGRLAAGVSLDDARAGARVAAAPLGLERSTCLEDGGAAIDPLAGTAGVLGLDLTVEPLPYTGMFGLRARHPDGLVGCYRPAGTWRCFVGVSAPDGGGPPLPEEVVASAAPAPGTEDRLATYGDRIHASGG